MLFAWQATSASGCMAENQALLQNENCNLQRKES
jgi:hypothetical protein